MISREINGYAKSDRGIIVRIPALHASSTVAWDKKILQEVLPHPFAYYLNVESAYCAWPCFANRCHKLQFKINILCIKCLE